MTCGQVWWLILGICALRLTYSKCTHTAVNTHTHTPWTHSRSSGQPFMLQHPGSSCGFNALLKGTSVVVLRVERALYIPPPTIPAGPRLELTTFRLRVRLSNPGVSNSSICLLLLFVYNNIVFIIIIICLSIICLVFVKLKSIIYCSKVLTKFM